MCSTLISLTLLYGEDWNKEPKADTPQPIPQPEQVIKETFNIEGIGINIARDMYENFAVIAMRNLPHQPKHDVYEFILDKLKILDRKY